MPTLNKINIRCNLVRLPLFIALLAAVPCVSAGILFQNILPDTNLNGFPTSASRSNVAVVYGSLPDANLPGYPDNSAPFTLGDQFLLTGDSVITSFTIYEVGNTPVASSTATATVTPNQEFNNISLFVGLDGSSLDSGMTLGGFMLSGASSQVFYPGGLNYQSINGETYFPVFAITFGGLNAHLAAGLYDFAVGASPIGNNSFALLMSDPSQGLREDSLGIAGHNFLYYFNDGPAGVPLATYQYAAGHDLVTNWNNTGALDANVLIEGTSVPEPATFGLIGLALAAGGFLGRRRIRR